MEITTKSGLLKRYFLHGIFFAILMTVIMIAWTFILVLLAIVGFILGLIIGFAVLFILMGAMNSWVTSIVWDVKVRSDWGTDLVHGFVLFIVLLIVSLPVTVISDFLAPVSEPTLVLLKFIVETIIMAFIDGYIARAVVGNWVMWE